MTTVLFAIPVMLFSMGFGWRRVTRGRSEHRSVETYGRALDRLGGVTRRSDAGAPVHVLDPDEAGRPHLRPASPAPPNAGPRIVGPPALPPTAPPLAAPRTGRLVFGEDDAPIGSLGPTGAAPPEHPDSGTTAVVGRPARIRRPPAIPRPEQAKRARLIAGVAAALVVAAAGIVSLTQLTGTPSAKPPKVGGPATTMTAPAVVAHPTTTVLAGLPPVLTPSASSATTVSYELPISGSYRVGFTTSGLCWVGVQSSVGGPYLWMQTFSTGESGSYQATGTVVVRIGAPKVVAISVNGTSVSLPAGRAQPYDVVLNEMG